MSWSCPKQLRLIPSLLLFGLLFSAIQSPPFWSARVRAQDADSSAVETSSDRTGNMVNEVIIDDSGIVLYSEDDSELDPDTFASDREARRRSAYDDYDDESVIFGRDIIIEEDESVRKDMVIFGGDLEIHGEVIGEIVVILGDVYLFDGAAVTGDILCVGGEVDVSPGAEHIGEVTPISTNFWNFSDRDWEWTGPGSLPLFWPLGVDNLGLRLVRSLLLVWIGFFLLARRIPNLAGTFRHRPWFSMLTGILTVLCAVLLAVPAALLIVLLCLLLIGIPVAILGIVVVIGLGLIAWLVPIFAFSRFTFEARGMHGFLSVTIWAFFFWVLAYLGRNFGIFDFVRVLLTLTGLGAMVLSRIGARPATAR